MAIGLSLSLVNPMRSKPGDLETLSRSKSWKLSSVSDEPVEKLMASAPANAVERKGIVLFVVTPACSAVPVECAQPAHQMLINEFVSEAKNSAQWLCLG